MERARKFGARRFRTRTRLTVEGGWVGGRGGGREGGLFCLVLFSLVICRKEGGAKSKRKRVMEKVEREKKGDELYKNQNPNRYQRTISLQCTTRRYKTRQHDKDNKLKSRKEK